MTAIPVVTAFVRQDFLAAISYRVKLLLSLAGLTIMTIPVYFVAQALQPTMAEAIQGHGRQYFAFVIVGMAVYRIVQVVVGSLSGAITNGIRTGTLEALFATPAGVPSMITGMIGFASLWALAEALFLLGVAALFGATFVVDRTLPAVVIALLLILAYVPFGIVAAAAFLAFRTTASIPTVVGAGSIFLGGVYYPTEVIPSWIEHLSLLVPMTYGLRAIRKVYLEGAPMADVGSDVGVLVCFVIGLLMVASFLFARALRYARRNGSLAHY